MRRRDFLAGAAALALGALGRRALGDVSLRAPAETVLDAAIRRARKSGRPLLALVIPREYVDKLERGHAFGEWLSHDCDFGMAPLALCEVVCAPSTELERAFGRDTDGEPLLMFVEYDRAPFPRVERWTTRLPDVPWLCTWCTDQTPSKTAAERVIDQRIALLGAWVLSQIVRREPGLWNADDPRVPELAARARLAYRDRAPPGGRWAYAEQFGSARVGVEPPPESDGFDLIARRTQRVLYLFDD